MPQTRLKDLAVGAPSSSVGLVTLGLVKPLLRDLSLAVEFCAAIFGIGDSAELVVAIVLGDRGLSRGLNLGFLVPFFSVSLD